MSGYVAGHLPRDPEGIIGCCEPHGISLDVSSRSLGVSSRIQEVSLARLSTSVLANHSDSNLHDLNSHESLMPSDLLPMSNLEQVIPKLQVTHICNIDHLV